MGSWDDRFHEHRLWTNAADLKAKADEMDPPEEEPGRDSQQYVTVVASMVEARKESTLPLLVTELMLDEAAGQVDAVTNYLDGWQAGSYNDSQMDQTTGGLVTAMAKWPAMTPEATSEAQASSIESMAKVASDTIEAVSHRREELQEVVDQLEARAIKLRETLDAQQALLAGAIEKFQADGTTATKAATDAWADERNAQQEKAEERLESLHNLEEQARDMVHATTGSTVATDYGKYARNKTIAAWICDVSAALIGSVGVAAIIYHLYSSDTGADGDVGLSLTRLAASLGTLGIAALVAHRGHDHHKEARAAKRTDLAIRRVGPFTANLPSGVRERIVVDLTDRVFIRGALDDEVTSDVGPLGSLWDRISKERKADEEQA